MPKLKHFDHLGTARFVTFNCYRNGQYLLHPTARELLIKNINSARTKHEFKLWGYVIMPEHVHLLMMPPDDMKLGLVIREIKSKMAREYFALTMSDVKGKKVFWQRRCFDHNCRTPETVREIIEYCHNNPVRRGLVKEPGDYRWSSYNWYQGNRDVPLPMDDFE
ncbi:MAG: transposase [FCB group bacterium]|nr:transposase [FCB group bacterium]